MKKIMLSFGMVIFCMASQAQNIRLNAYTNYVFDEGVDSYYSSTNYFNGKIRGGLLWGLGAEFLTNPNYGIEVLYQRQDSDGPATYYNGGLKNKDFKIGIDHIFLGFNRYFKTGNPKIEPYTGLMAGVSVFSLKNADPGERSSATKFGYGLRGGVNIWASNKVGIKLQAHVISAAQAFGGGFYVGTGGAGVGATSYSSFWQFGVGGGLTFKLGK